MTDIPKRLQNSLARITRQGGGNHDPSHVDGINRFPVAERTISFRERCLATKGGATSFVGSRRDGLFGGDEQTLHVVNA